MSFSLVNVRINTSTSLYQGLHYTQSVWRMATLKSSAISFVCLCVRFYQTACVSKARKNLSSQSAYSYISHHLGKKSSIAPTCVSESLIYTCTSNFKSHSITNLKVLLIFFTILRCVCGISYYWGLNSETVQNNRKTHLSYPVLL